MTVDLNVLMDGAILELAFSAAEEAQLGIGPEAAVPDPATEEFILPGDPQAVEISVGNRAGLGSSVKNRTIRLS